MADPYRYFRIEANELVGQLEQGLLDLERAPEAAQVAKLLRLAHTLKGAARIVKHTELAGLAHALEEVVMPLRDAASLALPDGAVALVQQMTAQVEALTPPERGPRRATSVLPPASHAGSPSATPRRTTPIPVIPSSRPSSQPMRVIPLADGGPLPRVDPGLLDQLLGGLAAARAELVALRRARPELDELDAFDRALGAARHEAEQLRLLPASAIASSLERTARDAARAIGKDIEVVVSGAETRVDARVLTGLHGALIQLVRNAVVHGIESPDERRAAGKPVAGRIAISIRAPTDRAILQCEDDGRGIDFAAVRAAANARGMFDRAIEPTQDQLIALLLGGGVSTASSVTALAGRGIGLDLAQDAAQALGGEVRVRTQPGVGTAIAIDVPSELASIEALIVTAGAHRVAVPRAAIRRVAQLAPDALQRGTLDGESGAKGDAPSDGLGQPCRLAALSRVLRSAPARPRCALVIGDGDACAAIAVDGILGFEYLVVRALDPQLPVDPVVRGVAIDVAGKPLPVLDPATLIAAIGALGPEPARAVTPPRPILVVDDSLTSRMLEQSILEAAGYQVDVAPSAEAGLARAAQRNYGLFLVDVEMPGLDGFGFISALRARSHTPAVLITSRDTDEDRRRGTAVGAQGYLVKGVLDPRELLSLVARLLA